MNSVGGFGEGEINGKPFYLFNFLSQTDNPTSSSYSSISGGGDDLPLLQPLFCCQSYRYTYQWNRRNDPNREEFVLVDDYPPFFGSDIYHHCKPPLCPLFGCNNKKTYDDEFQCSVCKRSELGAGYYKCVRCGHTFHKECIECPLEIKHPSFPFTSLKLYYPPTNQLDRLRCIYCQEKIENMIYYCPTNKLIMHPVCAMRPIPIVINHPKRHPHLLNFFPKQQFLPCDVCGLIKNHFPTYVCAMCVFVVHLDCVYSPHTIKISRHPHRISFTYTLPSGKLSCGVCRRNIDNNYGAYTSNKCDDYFVHTKCALRRDLWDGKELEGVPEVPEKVDEPPFKRISDGIILHFAHRHHLKFEINGVYDENKICQACILPIYEGNYYSCMDQCDFILHEECASAPREKQHALNAVSLKLKVVTKEYNRSDGYFKCGACRRRSDGFVYEDPVEGRCDFRLDLRCASVSEPFIYGGHKHPLFLALTPEEEEAVICQICQKVGDKSNDFRKLNCIECSFIICFTCATLPYKVRYKHDNHFLTFREKEEGNDHPGWCDICESEIVFSRKGFYSCDEYCSTTVHINCLLGGEDMYLMKPGQIISVGYTPYNIHILGNKTMSRPFCDGKEHRFPHRCPHKVVFKKVSRKILPSDLPEWNNMKYCSLHCYNPSLRGDSSF